MAPPTFDGRAFANWLKRWKQGERLEWAALARDSGVAVGTLQLLARGIPVKSALERGQTEMNPGITTVARVAYGLGLDFSYVASKGGLNPGGDRWMNFTKDERKLLAGLLRDSPQSMNGSALVRERMLADIEKTLIQEKVEA